MSDDKIVRLGGGPIPQPGQPSKTLVAFLEDQLERAKSGEIIGFAGAVLSGDRASTYWVVGLTGTFGMVGALQCASRVIERIAMDER